MPRYLIFSRSTILFLLLISMVFLLIGWAAFWTQLTVTALQHRQLSLASQNAQRALVIVKPISIISFQHIPDLELWRSGLEMVAASALLQVDLPAFMQQLLSPSDTQQLELRKNLATRVDIHAQKLARATQDFEENLPKTFLSRRLIQPQLTSMLNQLAQTLPATVTTKEVSLTQLTADFNQIINVFAHNPANILLLFQNSEELRATGGFMGSYALIQLENGQAQSLEVQDIYEPDGQFRGFIAAPPGVHEYLSGGQGWRLPNANWSADFPTSAQTIMDFFMKANKPTIDHVIAFNTSVVEDLLRITGGMVLPDYQVTITAENLTTLARSDRNTFFPGSQQKRNFLAALFTQLKLKMSTLSAAEQVAVLNLVAQKFQTKEIQISSRLPELQQIWQHYGLGGTVTDQSFFVFPIESNVGINKANKKIQREMKLQKNAQEFIITLQLSNQNSPNEFEPPVPPQTRPRPLDYVNYQRFWLPTSVQVQSVVIDGQTVTDWQEADLTLLAAQKIKEIGFLVPVPVGETRTAVVTIQLPATMNSAQLFLYKQSGTPPIPYQVEWDGRSQFFSLDRDQQLQKL